MGLAMLGFGLAPALPFALGALVVAGFCFMMTNTAATTSLMRDSAPDQRGRVMALWSLCFLGTRPLASLVDGALASAAGLRVAAVALTVPVLIAAAVTSRLHARTDPGASPSLDQRRSHE
jgi:sugar phosphate permease